MTEEGRRDPQSVLKDEILADARRQADRTVTRAKREAQDIAKKGTAEAEAERDQRMAEARAEAQRRRNLTLAIVPVEVGRMRARRLEDALMSVREEATRRLIAREGYDYAATLVAWAAQAVGHMTGQTFVLELSEADRRAFGGSLPQAVREAVKRPDLNITVAEEAAKIEGGVIVRGADGREVWDNSLLSRTDRLWPALRRQIGDTMETVRAQPAAAPSGDAPKES